MKDSNNKNQNKQQARLNKNLILLGISLIVIVSYLMLNNRTDETDAHRPSVYTDGFPVLSIDVDFAFPIDWSASAYDLQFFRENWLGATLNISNTSAEFEMSNVDILARGRGNSTWWSFGEKRPIRFRFPDDAWQGVLD